MREAARVAFKRGLVIAEERDDALCQMQLLCPLHMFHFSHAVHMAVRGTASCCGVV
jgi:hypothetical protein